MAGGQGTWGVGLTGTQQGGDGLAPQVWGAALGLLRVPPSQQLLVLFPARAALHLRVSVHILSEVPGLCLSLPFQPRQLLLPLVEPLAPGLGVRLPSSHVGWEQLGGGGKQEGMAAVRSHVGEGDLLKVPAGLTSTHDPVLYFAILWAAMRSLLAQIRAGLQGPQKLKGAQRALYSA